MYSIGMGTAEAGRDQAALIEITAEPEFGDKINPGLAKITSEEVVPQSHFASPFCK
jgi:hypothetical protein